jgi:hypothetical protein
MRMCGYGAHFIAAADILYPDEWSLPHFEFLTSVRRVPLNIARNYS